MVDSVPVFGANTYSSDASDSNSEVPAVSIRGFVKTFGKKVAVDNLSLDIPAGSFYGLVGPNGAGTVSYTHLRAHETKANLVCRLLLEKKKR